MRMKLVPNPSFEPHIEASAARDNVKRPSRQEQDNLIDIIISK